MVVDVNGLVVVIEVLPKLWMVVVSGGSRWMGGRGGFNVTGL
jgi:hypothetical protein